MFLGDLIKIASDRAKSFIGFISRYFVTAPVIMFSLLTVFLTGFLILELQVIVKDIFIYESDSRITDVSLSVRLSPKHKNNEIILVVISAMGGRDDKRQTIRSVSQLHSQDSPRYHHSDI